MKMSGTSQTVLLNDNATIFCQVYGDPSPNITIMGVTWFWKNPGSATEVKLFEFFGGQQMTGRPGAMVPLKSLESGNASLQLPGIQLREAGEYRCEVVITPHKAVGQVKLEVVGEFPGDRALWFPWYCGLGWSCGWARWSRGLEHAYESDRWV